MNIIQELNRLILSAQQHHVCIHSSSVASEIPCSVCVQAVFFYKFAILGGRYGGNEISHNLWLLLIGHNFTSLISVFGKKGPNKFLAFGEVASASAHPAICDNYSTVLMYMYKKMFIFTS